jgi:hypothetical protein
VLKARENHTIKGKGRAVDFSNSNSNNFNNIREISENRGIITRCP